MEFTLMDAFAAQVKMNHLGETLVSMKRTRTFESQIWLYILTLLLYAPVTLSKSSSLWTWEMVWVLNEMMSIKGFGPYLGPSTCSINCYFAFLGPCLPSSLLPLMLTCLSLLSSDFFLPHLSWILLPPNLPKTDMKCFLESHKFLICCMECESLVIVGIALRVLSGDNYSMWTVGQWTSVHLCSCCL